MIQQMRQLILLGAKFLLYILYIANGSGTAKLWVMWKDLISLHGIATHEQFITCAIGPDL